MAVLKGYGRKVVNKKSILYHGPLAENEAVTTALISRVSKKVLEVLAMQPRVRSLVI